MGDKQKPKQKYKNPFKEWSAEETEGTYENYKIKCFSLRLDESFSDDERGI